MAFGCTNAFRGIGGTTAIKVHSGRRHRQIYNQHLVQSEIEIIYSMIVLHFHELFARTLAATAAGAAHRCQRCYQSLSRDETGQHYFVQFQDVELHSRF